MSVGQVSKYCQMLSGYLPSPWIINSAARELVDEVVGVWR